MDTYKKCETCGHYGPVTLVTRLNDAARALIAEGRVKLGELPAHVHDALVEFPLFRFGFDDFLGDPANDSIVGKFRCALKFNDTYHFFMCVISPTPKPISHERGDLIELPIVTIHTFGVTRLLDDRDALADLLNRNLEALRLYVIERTANLASAGAED